MTALLTALALVAFAANSILTRMALGAGAMDAATFTTVRIVLHESVNPRLTVSAAAVIGGLALVLSARSR